MKEKLEASIQTDPDYTEDKLSKKVKKYKNRFKKSQEEADTEKEKTNELLEEIQKLKEKLSIKREKNEELSRKLYSSIDFSGKAKAEVLKMKELNEIVIRKLKKVRISSTIKLITHVYNNSDNWTTSLLCINLMHCMMKKMFVFPAKMMEASVSTEDKIKPPRGLFKKLFN